MDTTNQGLARKARHRHAIGSEQLASRGEVDAALKSLTEFTADPTTLITRPMRLPGPGQTTNGRHAASIAPVMSFTEMARESNGSKVVGKVKRADGQCITAPASI
jgi:hypothetical protein